MLGYAYRNFFRDYYHHNCRIETPVLDYYFKSVRAHWDIKASITASRQKMGYLE